MSEIRTLRVGAPCRILNGRRDRAHRAVVKAVSLNLGAITVENLDKGGRYQFSLATGLPAADGAVLAWVDVPPLLVTVDDPRAVELDKHRKHREYREDLDFAAHQFRVDPTRANLDAMQKVVDDWAAHSLVD